MALSYYYCTLDNVKSELLGLDISDLPGTIETRITDDYIPEVQRYVDEFCGTNFDATEVEEFYDGNGLGKMILNHRPVREIVNVVLYLIPSAQWFQFKRWFYVNDRDILGTKVGRRGGVEPKSDEKPPYAYNEDLDLGYLNEVTVGSETVDFSNTEEQYGKSDLFIDMKLGTLTVPPRILYMESQAVPFWNYTWLSGTQNIRVQYVYGYSDPTQADDLLGGANGNLPKEITQATAKLVAAKVLQEKGLFMSAGGRSFSTDGVNFSYGEVPYEGAIKLLTDQAESRLKRYRQPRV